MISASDEGRMHYSIWDHVYRKFVPSVARISYNPVVKLACNALAGLISLPFAELRDLPPNHLRIRVGVGNGIVTNHIHYLQMGSNFWHYFLSRQYCDFSSDVVELGCGCGRIAYPLKGAWFTGTYVGVDIDREMIEFCRQSFPQERFEFILSPHISKNYSSSGVGANRDNQLALSIAEAGSKRFVYSVSLYSHLLEDEVFAYLLETFRILSSGGYMFMTFFCVEHVKRGSRWTFAHRNGHAYVENDRYPEAAVAYEEGYMIELVKTAGFRELSIIPGDVQSMLVARK
jgi:SAM-dependent methyltransferase